MQILCLNPLVVIVDNFCNKEIADHLIGLAQSRLERARVVSRSNMGPEVHEARTNSDATIDQWSDQKATELAQKISSIVRLPPENSEPGKLLHYVEKQEFEPHLDAFGKSAGEVQRLGEGGQRLFTSILYLNSPQNGGETEFPNLKISIKPKLGRLLVFGNTYPGTSQPHPHSKHAGRPVTNCEKLAFTLWWRQLAYQQQREYPAETGTLNFY